MRAMTAVVMVFLTVGIGVWACDNKPTPQTSGTGAGSPSATVFANTSAGPENAREGPRGGPALSSSSAVDARPGTNTESGQSVIPQIRSFTTIELTSGKVISESVFTFDCAVGCVVRQRFAHQTPLLENRQNTQGRMLQLVQKVATEFKGIHSFDVRTFHNSFQDFNDSLPECCGKPVYVLGRFIEGALELTSSEPAFSLTVDNALDEDIVLSLENADSIGMRKKTQRVVEFQPGRRRFSVTKQVDKSLVESLLLDANQKEVASGTRIFVYNVKGANSYTVQ
jgi:hypothetical protein